jgi:hypothetical protein
LDDKSRRRAWLLSLDPGCTVEERFATNAAPSTLPVAAERQSGPVQMCSSQGGSTVPPESGSKRFNSGTSLAPGKAAAVEASASFDDSLTKACRHCDSRTSVTNFTSATTQEGEDL